MENIYLQKIRSFVTFNDLEVKIFKDIQQTGNFFKSNYIKKDIYINLIWQRDTVLKNMKGQVVEINRHFNKVTQYL